MESSSSSMLALKLAIGLDTDPCRDLQPPFSAAPPLTLAVIASPLGRTGRSRKFSCFAVAWRLTGGMYEALGAWVPLGTARLLLAFMWRGTRVWDMFTGAPPAEAVFCCCRFLVWDLPNVPISVPIGKDSFDASGAKVDGKRLTGCDENELPWSSTMSCWNEKIIRRINNTY